MRWVSDEDVDRYTAFAALVTSDVSYRDCGVMGICGFYIVFGKIYGSQTRFLSVARPDSLLAMGVSQFNQR
jgi:hypothetical protein